MNVLTDRQDTYVLNDIIINDLTLKGVNFTKELLRCEPSKGDEDPSMLYI
jgi:hypothetical protein